MSTRFKEFLKEIKPYVVVVGSYARGTQTEYSDIDFYIKRRPLKEIEDSGYEIDEHYMPEILDIINKYNFETSSVIIGHICVERGNEVSIMTELSSHYAIPKGSEIFKINILGMEFEAAIDVKDTPYENFFDYEE